MIENTDLNQLLKQLKQEPEHIEFDQVIGIINQYYQYQPTRFYNGLDENKLTNDAGTNEGSCKIFAFAKINNLTKEETLACFGHFYRDDVLKHPDGVDHRNIRNFMRDGWDGIQFESTALSPY